jgi:DNA (cytosine-5)-methyltransferase 1
LILLDLFCKQGGAAAGYARAGWTVIGSDIEPQPRYPFAFYQGDWRDALALFGPHVDAVHASPPCPRYTTGGRVRNREQRPDLVGPVRDALRELGRPYVIENVPGAPLEDPIMLCGSMFGLRVKRHRLFEIRPAIEPPTACDAATHEAQRPIVGVYGRPHGNAGAWPGMLPSTVETWSWAMGGLDWMDADGMSQAIPPAYTAWIGHRMRRPRSSNTAAGSHEIGTGRPLPSASS